MPPVPAKSPRRRPQKPGGRCHRYDHESDRAIAGDPSARYLAALDSQVAKLTARIERVEMLVQLQVKMTALLGGSVARLPLPASDTNTLPTALAAQQRRDKLRKTLLAHLEETAGNVAEVARRMGRARPMVHRWLKRFDINPALYRPR